MRHKAGQYGRATAAKLLRKSVMLHDIDIIIDDIQRKSDSLASEADILARKAAAEERIKSIRRNTD